MSEQASGRIMTFSELATALGAVSLAVGSVQQWTEESLTSLSVSTGPRVDSDISGSASYADGLHGLESWGPLFVLLALGSVYLVYRRRSYRRSGTEPNSRIKVYNVVAVVALIVFVLFTRAADPEADLALGGVAVLIGVLLLLAPATYHGIVLRIVGLFIERDTDDT